MISCKVKQLTTRKHTVFFSLALFWSAIVQSCIVCCKIESHLPFVSTKHLDMKVSLLSKQRISAQPPETQEMHKGPFLSPLLHQHQLPYNHFKIHQLFKSNMSKGIDRQQQKCVYRPNTKHGLRFLAGQWTPKIIPCRINIWWKINIYAILLPLLHLPFIHASIYQLIHSYIY